MAEVELGLTEGLQRDSAANCDNLFTLPNSVLGKRLGHLGPGKVYELDAALSIALGLR